MTVQPWDQVAQPMYRMYLWPSDDKQGGTLTTKSGIGDTPITRIVTMKRTQVLMQPDQLTVTFALSDPDTGGFSPQSALLKGTAGFGKGTYYEIYIGKDLSPMNSQGGFDWTKDAAIRAPWASGYVQDVTKTATKGATFDMTGASAMIWLANFRNLNALEMDFKTNDRNKKNDYNSSYMDVMYALNGLDGSGGEGSPNIAQGPYQKGLLTGSGWLAVYVDGIKGKNYDFTKMPGYGDSWLTTWETVLTNLQTIAQHYNLFFREGEVKGQPSTGHNGVLEFGPLNDPSNIAIWGGEELDILMGNMVDEQGNVRATANAMDAAEYLGGISVIQAAQYEDKMDTIVNLVWALGHGTTGATLVTISPFFHPLLDKKGKVNSQNTIQTGPLQYSWIGSASGVTGYYSLNVPSSYYSAASDPGKHDYYWRWQSAPGTRVYYLMKTLIAGNKTYPGLVAGWDTDPAMGPIIYYQLVAAQNQDGTFAYGVMEMNSAMKYGIHEFTLKEAKTSNEYLLLSSAIGAAESKAETTPTWMFPVKHPVDPVSGLPSPSTSIGAGPNFAKVGQTLDIKFTGYVYESIYQGNDAQWYGEGKSYDYIHFPTTGYTIGSTIIPNDINTEVNGLVIDQHMFSKIDRIAQIDETWTGHVYEVSYTMGQGKWSKQHWADKIAARFENQQKAPPTAYPTRHLKDVHFDKLSLIVEFGAHIDSKVGALILPSSGNLDGSVINPSPGGIAVTNINHDHFFDDSHKVSFTVVAEHPGCVVDFWFHKPLQHHLVDINVDINEAYGIFRLGFSDIGVNGKAIKGGSSSGKKSGYYVCKTVDGGSGTSTYSEFKTGLTLGDHNTNFGPLYINAMYEVTLQWNDNIHKAWVQNKSKKGQHHELVARWDDLGGANETPILGDYDTTQTPPKPIIDPRTGKPQSQYGAIGWRCFGGDGIKGAKVFNIDVHPLRNSKGISSVGEVRPDGSQVSVNTHLPNGGSSGTVYDGAAQDPSKADEFISANTQIHYSGKTFTFDQFLTGTYPAKLQITSPLSSTSSQILFDTLLYPHFKFKGLPLLALPFHITDGFKLTITGSVNNVIISEVLDITNFIGIKVDNFDPNDPWFKGIEIDGSTALGIENAYPVGSTISWLQQGHGGKVHSQHFTGNHTFTDIGTGEKFKDTGWGQVIATLQGRSLIIFPDGHLGWDNEHKTVSGPIGSGLKTVAYEALQGSEFAAGLDGHGTTLFNATEYGSVTQKAYLYSEGTTHSVAGSYLAEIDPSNNLMFYKTTDPSATTVSQLGNPWNSGDPNSMPVSWVYEEQLTGATADSDDFLQITPAATFIGSITGTSTPIVGGPANNVMWQDCQLLKDADARGNIQRRQFHLHKDVTFNFPVYINPANFNATTTGAVGDVLISNGGSYTTLPTGVTFTGSGSGATGTVVTHGNTVIGVAITNGGTGYTDVPVVSFTGGTGTAATATATLATEAKTLGGECTLREDLPVGSTSIPIIEPVDELSFEVGDLWALSPSKDESQNFGSERETVTFAGIDTVNSNSILISSGTTYPHFAAEPILQVTYYGVLVNSGSNLTSGQAMDDILPGADVIAFGLLAEYQETTALGASGAVSAIGTATVLFAKPVSDWAIHSNDLPLMIEYDYASPRPNAEILAGGSYTLTTDSKGHATGITANFTQTHAPGFTVTYARWHRGWYGDPGWICPYEHDTQINSQIPTYQVKVGATRAMKHLGSLSGPNDLRAGEWIDYTCKASQLGLYHTNGNFRRPVLVGCEIAVHATTPTTVMFDAHSAGTPKPKPTTKSKIKDETITFRHKNAKALGDAHFHSDLYMWMEKNSAAATNVDAIGHADNNYYIHWEHDSTPGGTQPGTIITHKGPVAKPLEKATSYSVYAGARADNTSGGVSEDHVNWGIPAWPVVRSSGGAMVPATLTDGTTFDAATPNRIAWFHLIFNSNSSGFWVHDPGVKAPSGSGANDRETWIPGYHSYFSNFTATGALTGTVPSSDLKQWQDYLSNYSNSSFTTATNTPQHVYPSVVLNKGAKDAMPFILESATLSGSVVNLTFGNVPGDSSTVSTGNIAGQTGGYAMVTGHFDWGKKPSGGAILNGPHEDFFKVGQVNNVPDPGTNEYAILTIGPHGKKPSKSTRKGSVTPSKSHQTHSGVQNHHNLAFSLSSKGKTPNTIRQSTFHATKKHANNQRAQIETHTGKFIGALPFSGGKQQNVFINNVNPHDYVVYDIGSKTGYTPGFYVYESTGTHSSWLSTSPAPAKYAGQTTTPQPLNVGRCYTHGRFDPHKDDSLGFILIGRISEYPDHHTRQYDLQTTKPSTSRATGKTIASKAVGRKHTHPHHPHKKKRHKKTATQYGNKAGTATKKKKHSIARQHHYGG